MNERLLKAIAIAILVVVTGAVVGAGFLSTWFFVRFIAEGKWLYAILICLAYMAIGLAIGIRRSRRMGG